MTTPDLDARLRDRLRLEREARGWSLADLAARSGVSRAQIHKVERGRASPSAALLFRLCAAFGLSLAALAARAEAGGRVLRVEDQARRRDPGTGIVHREIAPAPGSDLPLDLVGTVLPAGAVLPVPAESYAFLRPVVLVLEGGLAVEEDEETVHLRPGDSLQLGPPAPRAFRANGGPCSFLVAAVRR